MRALTVPFLSDNLQTAIYAQVRPVRKSGVRLEIEFVQVKGQTSKLICHNYGHGGAGVSLAYGCAERVV